ncbi:MAG: helix-turn-helix domain-containing protein [Firmicutes bacterium]|nr:helix-turn-helix domain-containing protein [Bacillota bacterium]
MKKHERREIFSKRMIELRNSEGFSQSKLAKELGVSSGSIAMWETKQREPKLDMLAKIAIYFDVSSDYLIGLKEYHE